MVTGLLLLSAALSVSALPVRTEVSHERISTDEAEGLGAEPFQGTRVIVVQAPTNVCGTAVLTLSHDSRSRASRGTLTNFTAVARNGRMRFLTNLPYERQYQFLRVSAPGLDKFTPITVAGEFVQTAAEALRMDVETGNLLHIVRPGTSERATVVFRNPLSKSGHWKGTLRCRDVFDRTVNVPFDIRIEAGAQTAVSLPHPMPAKGQWYVSAEIEGADGSKATCERSFAVVPRHDPTPIVEKPTFRFGIHASYPMERADIRKRTIDALVATGAKLTRVDGPFEFFSAWSREKDGIRFEASDRLLDELRGNGLSIMAITGGVPFWWACDPEKKKAREKYKFDWLIPSRPGLMRTYMKAIASRYGTKIDYYEIGNEWDLAPKGVLPVNEALELQREAYEGAHEGCPDVCVTPNGWAGGSSDKGLLKKGHYGCVLLEEFAQHPELYDAWLWHCHGDMGWYAYGLPSDFIPFYRRTGLGKQKKPWAPGETGMTCFKVGEREVARTVWAKTLFAWSWGAADYIWYCLRATGWLDGHEPGYGMMTPDFRPRASFPAFAALTEVFQGLKPDGRIHSRQHRHFLRFRGKKENFEGIVLAGWDFRLKEPVSVTVRTDAKSAELVDFMGNRMPIALKGGELSFPLAADPQAVLLYGAKSAEAANYDELRAFSAEVRTIPDDAGERSPDFTLREAPFVRELFYANPAQEHRLWQGPKDASAEVWLRRTGDDLTVRIEVEDDVDASGDGIELLLEVPGRETRRFPVIGTDGVVTKRERVGTRTTYDVRIDGRSFGFDAQTMRQGIGFGVYVMEDDGEGADGWLQLFKESDDPVRVRFK